MSSDTRKAGDDVSPLAYRLARAKYEDQTWLEQLRRAVYQELFIATWGAWDEARHSRHCTECWERGEIFCVEVDGARVGMIQLFEYADAIEVGEIQIEPPYQGRGIGTRLLRDVIVRARDGRKKVSLSTGLKNHRAFRLYERLGFRRVTQTDTHDHMECTPK
jgi:ribosomal protein S18 acetylase RimI-like enzyme